jgi:parallel beta-helix repeat protein
LNRGDGIRGEFGSCSIVANACAKNGNGGDGAGVHVTGGADLIEGNSVTGNDRGIELDANNSNVIIKNRANGNTTDYDIPAGNNIVGTIVTTGAAMNSATNSNINISY